MFQIERWFINVCTRWEFLNYHPAESSLSSSSLFLTLIEKNKILHFLGVLAEEEG